MEREKIDAALKEHVVPVLRSMGFKGSFPHFRRNTGQQIDLLTFQFDKHGGGFVVEVAVSPTEGVTLHWGEQIPAAKWSPRICIPINAFGWARPWKETTGSDMTIKAPALPDSKIRPGRYCLT